MKQCLLFVLLLGCQSIHASGQDCQSILRELKAPKKVKTRGKQHVARWEDVDRLLNDLQKSSGNCTFRFEQVFRIDREEALFPVTNSVLRIIPEKSFEGLAVFTNDGYELGEFAGRVKYERSGGLYALESYSLYYFQYKDSSGRFQSVGKDLLQDSFAVRWADLKQKIAIAPESVE